MMKRLKDHIQEKLSALELRNFSESFTTEAAVLIPIFEHQGQPHFLLTRRSDEVQTHKGQISFPGGMRSGSESLERTALRETREEVGIDGSQIQIIGRFHDYLSVTDARVSPFVGYLGEPFVPKPHAREVAEILYVPFEVFRNPSLLRTENWVRNGRTITVHFYTYGKFQIWGLTARMIWDFIRELDPESIR